MWSTMGTLEISQLYSANMDWLLHLQKSRSSPTAPWLLNHGSQESRGEATICLSHGASRPRSCWERVRMPHEFTSSGGRRENELKDSWSINTGCHRRPLKVCLRLFLLLSIFSHLFASLLSLPFFLLFFFFFAKGWPCMAPGPWLVGLQSAESIDRASRALSTCSRSNKSITLLL